jgi:hypothetical protein
VFFARGVDQEGVQGVKCGVTALILTEEEESVGAHAVG